MLLLTLLVVVVLLGGAVAWARPLLLTGTGYAAHNACAVQLVAGRDADAPAADLPPNPLVPVMSTSVDAANGTARAGVFGLFGQTAHFTDGLGCTLAADTPDLPTPPAVTTATEGEWPTGEQVTPPPAHVDVALLEQAIDEAFAEDVPEGRSVGTRAVVVVHDGRIVAERYADGFDADTRQLGWSMAKSVTNAMVGRLVAEGQLDVSEDHLREDWTDGRGDITLDDLLRMSSGLEWDEAYSLGSVITEMLYLREDMGGFAASQPLVHEPGSHQQYSSGTTNIVCDLLQDRTGMGVELAHELVFQPLGMGSAVLEPDAEGGLVCSSYLWATPRDWARFGLWFARGGEWDGAQLLPADWVEYSSRTEPREGEQEGHAAHWWANRLPDGSLQLPDLPEDTFWASGHDGQKVYVVPSADLVVVRMGFTPEIPGAELGLDQLVASALRAVGEDS